jgi:hypothetical protein
MGTGTLTNRSSGQTITADFFNDIHGALNNDLVGRNSSGIATAGQSLGTNAIPWGNLYATGLILDGDAVDVSQITSVANRVVSGATRTLSSYPDFLRADGSALEFDVLGATTDLSLSINGTAVTVNTDITVSSVTAAPSSNNTCLVNDLNIVNGYYYGEDGGSITIDNVGSEISSRVGEFAAFESTNGEYLFAYIKSSTELTNVYRGFYFDDSGDPVERADLSNNDTLTILSTGWVFVENNGTTVDVSYTTPAIQYSAPSSPSTGDYWFDIPNQTWKRYSGSGWDIINRTYIGQVIANTTAVVGTRCQDFSKNFKGTNNVELEIFSTEIVRSKNAYSRISIYGADLAVDNTLLNWNITTDLASGLTEASSTVYYLYLSDEGERVIDTVKPHYRYDLQGDYHPYESWRLIGMAYNDGSSDITLVWDENSKLDTESGESGAYSSSTTSYQAITNLSVSFLSRGKGKFITGVHSSSTSGGFIGVGGTGSRAASVRYVHNSNVYYATRVVITDGSTTYFGANVPPTQIESRLGLNTVRLDLLAESAGTTAYAQYLTLYARES